MAYQEGQYISQFLNTMPTQLANYAQQQESKRQFDAMQGLRVSAEERALAAEGRAAEQFKYDKIQKNLLSLALKANRDIMHERYDAEARKRKALEERSLPERLYTGWGNLGMPMWTPQTGLEWAETEDEWAQRTTGYDPWDERFRPQDLPEGLSLDPESYQYLGGLGGYTHPRRSMLQMAYPMGGQ